MHLKFNSSGEMLEVLHVKNVDELNRLESLSTVINMSWQNKRLVETSREIFFKHYKYLPGGLWKRILDLKSENFDVHIDNWHINEAITKDFIEKFIDDKRYTWSLAEHQLNAVYAALKFKRTCQEIGTSGGKTFITCCLASILLATNKYKSDKKFLVIVPSQLLCNQGFNDFESYQSNYDVKELKVYKIFAGAKNKYSMNDANVVFSTYQSLLVMPDDFFAQFNWVFVDEGHRAINATVEIIKKLRHCSYRFAFSGLLPNRNTAEAMKLEIYVGALVYSYKTARLRDAGFTANFKIIPITIKHSDEATKEYYEKLAYELNTRSRYKVIISRLEELRKTNAILTEEYQKLVAEEAYLRSLDMHKDFNRRLYEEDYLSSNEARLKVIAEFAAKGKFNTLILARRKNEVRGIYETLSNINTKTTHLIMGGVSNADKDSTVNTIKHGTSGSHDLVGNVDMIGTGISINNLMHGIFTGIGKSPYTAVQTIGRLIRKHDDKDIAIIFDIRDDLTTKNKNVPYYARTSYSMMHSYARHQTYRLEDYEIVKTEYTIAI
jgi:superfamily II DNA or RNA helicase